MGTPWKSGSSITLRVLVCQILGFGSLGSKNALFMTMSVFRHLSFPSLPRVKSWGDRGHHSLCTDSYEVSFTTWPHPAEATGPPGLLCWGLWPAQWWVYQGDDAPAKSFCIIGLQTHIVFAFLQKEKLKQWGVGSSPGLYHTKCWAWIESVARNGCVPCTAIALCFLQPCGPLQMGLIYFLTLILSTASNRECVLKCFVKWTVDDVLKLWFHSFLPFDPSCHPSLGCLPYIMETLMPAHGNTVLFRNQMHLWTGFCEWENIL